MVRRSDATTWFLFVASGWLAGILCLWLAMHDAEAAFARAAIPAPWLRHASNAAPWADVAAWLLPAIGLLLAWRWFSSGTDRLLTWLPRGWVLAASTVLATAATLAAAVLAALAIQRAALHLASAEGHEAVVEVAEKLTVIGFVALTAIAGAVRYVREKLNLEAQALEYKDALGRFERAERLLAEGADPASGNPANLADAQRVVCDLGLLALRENEAWLKAHRERPLSPVVG
jgi:hypothetical protein